MISLRYHIVAIVAVFLALAVGVLVGGAFVQPALEERLKSQTEELGRGNDALREQLDEIRTQVAGADAFVDATLPYLTRNRLLGRSVVVVAGEGVEDAVLGATQRSLQEAGSNVVAVISARESIASQDPETQARLAELIGSPDATGEDLPGLTATALADRLANGSDAPGPADDLLAQLLSGGFLAPIGSGLSEAALEEIGSEGQIVVVLGGGQDEEPAMPPEAFAVPLARELVDLGVPVAAGESSSTPVSFVGQVRDGGTDGLVTVDDLDLSMGAAALVLGLDQLLLTGEGGAYGLADGAEPLPPLP